MKTLKVFTDGASKGNPGPAAIGAVVIDGNKEIEISEPIGVATNNVAEYRAAIRALEIAIKLKADAIELYSDSELLIRQLKGIYKVKDSKLLKLYQRIQNLLGQFKDYTITHIPRQMNSRADSLARKALMGDE